MRSDIRSIRANPSPLLWAPALCLCFAAGYHLLPGIMLPVKSFLGVRSFQGQLLDIIIPATALASLAGLAAALYKPQISRQVSMALLAGIFALGLCYYIPFTNDDSFIFFRYAGNIASGKGIVFNEGQRVEGVTSLGWTLILSGLARAGLDVMLSAKVLGGLLSLASILLMYKGTLAISQSPLVAFASAFALAVNQLFQSWSGSGMDVALFFFWETLVLYTMFSGKAGPKRIAALSMAGFLVRPEAFFVSAVLWAYLFLTAGREGNASRKEVIAQAALTAGFGLCLFMFRKIYFGSFLPTTYYAKSYLGLSDGIAYLAVSSRVLGISFVAVSLAGIALYARRAPYLPAVFLLYAAYLVRVGGDVLSQRFALFLVPFLIAGFSVSMHQLKRLWPRAQLVVICLFLAYFSVQNIGYMRQLQGNYFDQRGSFYVPLNATGTFETDYLAGRMIHREAVEGDVLLTDNIGASGYYGGIPVVDTSGLVTPEIAMSIHANDADAIRDYIAGIDARWILVNKAGNGVDGLDMAGDVSYIVDHNYEPVRTWISKTGYARTLYRRSGN